MKKKLFLFIFALSCAVSAAELPAPVRAAVPPIIDGKLTDAVWQNAPAFRSFRGYNTKTPQEASVQLVCTDSALIVGIKAMVPENRRQTPDAAKNASGAYRAEGVEIMLDPTGSGDSYFHLLLNIANRHEFAKREQGGFVTSKLDHCEWKHAVHLDRDFWSAEIRIPFYSLGLNKQIAAEKHPWLLNAVYNHYPAQGKNPVISSLSGDVHAPGKFPAFAAPAGKLEDYCLQAVPGRSEATIKAQSAECIFHYTVQNDTPRSFDGILELAFQSDDKNFRTARKEIKQLAAGAAVDVAVGKISFEKPGLYQGTATLRSRRDNSIRAREYFTHQVSLSPLKVTLIDPHYRNAVFASQKLDKVRYTVSFSTGEPPRGSTLHTGIAQNGKVLLEKRQPLAATQTVEFPVAALPEGRLTVFAKLYDSRGVLLGEITEPLRKLPFQTGEVWRDKDGVWRIEGKKTFILASWGASAPSFLPEYNIVVELRNDTRSEHKFINRSTIFGISKLRNRLKRDGATPEVVEEYRKIVRRTQDDPKLFAHYLCDEPDCFGYTAAMLEPVAAAIADEDPYHPVLISTGSSGVTAYLQCGELNGFHCYPFPRQGTSMNQFNKIVTLMDRQKSILAKPGTPAQDIIYLHQGFNYGDCGTSAQNRVPTYEEFRNQNFMALILGAKGLYHYNRTEESYPELYFGVPQLIKEEKLVGERAVIQPDAGEKFSADVPEIRALVKRNDRGEFWLVVCNVSNRTLEAKLSFAPFAEKPFTVLSENRTLARQTEVVEHFTPYQVHIYTDAKNLPRLKSVAEINAAIEEIYAKRAKPGNLAYQRYENERLQVTASSNRFGKKRATQALWHLTDGMTEGPLASGTHGGGVIAYQDATPNKLPDYVQYEFKKPVTVGRVVLYPVENSLKSYEIQVRKDKDFTTVKKVSDADGSRQSVTFAPVETDCIRLLVTGTRGPRTGLYEMEVYEK